MEGFKYNIPYTYKKINDDYELVLIETPKNVNYRFILVR